MRLSRRQTHSPVEPVAELEKGNTFNGGAGQVNVDRSLPEGNAATLTHSSALPMNTQLERGEVPSGGFRNRPRVRSFPPIA